MDEAMNPLAILAVGLDGSVLPNQTARRFASGRAVEIRVQEHKSIVRIRFQEMQPRNTWQIDAPQRTASTPT